MFKNKETGFLQSVQDALSYNLNLPIRIVDVQRLKNLTDVEMDVSETKAKTDLLGIYEIISNNINDTAHSENDGYSERIYTPYEIQNNNNIRQIEGLSFESTGSHSFNRASEWSDSGYYKANLNLSDLEDDIFFTQTSNLPSINNLFRLSAQWRWFEILWFYINKDKFTTSSDEWFADDVFAISGWRFYWKPFRNHANKLIVVGPIRVVEDEIECGEFNNQVREYTLELFSRFHHFYGRWGFTKRFSKIDMDRHYSASPSINKSVVVKKVEFLERVYSYISDNCDVIFDLKLPEHVSRKSVIEKITDVCVSLVRIAESKEYYSLVEEELMSRSQGISTQIRRYTDYIKKGVKEQSYNFTIPILVEEEKVVSFRCSVSTMKDTFEHGRPSSLESKYFGGISFSDEGKGFYSHVSQGVGMNRELDDTSKAMAYLKENMLKWCEAAQYRKKYHINMNCRLLGDWINHQYLTSSSGLYGSKESARDWSIYNYICDYVSVSTRTDLCNIYRYTPHSRSGDLSIFGSSMGVKYWSQEEIADVAKEMKDLSLRQDLSLEEKARISVVYRAIHECNTAYYFGEVIGGVGEFKDLTWPKDCPRPGTVVAVPILVEGRVWGVLEVVSRQSDGVELITKLSLYEYTSVLSVYFFSITYNRNVTKMGHWGVSVFSEMPGAIEDISDKHANYICRINLAKSVIILLRDNLVSHRYKIVGHAGLGMQLNKKSRPSINILSSRNSRFLSVRLHKKFSESGLRYICGLIDPTQEDRTVSDMPEYHVLGKKYHEDLKGRSDITEFVSADIKQIIGFAFNVDDWGLVDSNDVFGVSNIQLRSSDDGPTGMVLVYYDKFINRQHWHGLNSDIALRLTNFYDDMLIKKNQQNDMGRLLRHEFKQSVEAVGTTVNDIGATAENIYNYFRRLPEGEGHGGSQEAVYDSEIFRSGLASSRSLVEKIRNFRDLHDQLSVQVLEIERKDHTEVKILNSQVYDADSTVYTEIRKVVVDIMNQYKDRLKSRKLYVDYSTIPEGLRLRIRPAYTHHLIRNIFDNWYKYAKYRTTLNVSINPEYHSHSRHDMYTISFDNVTSKPVTKEEVQEWFEFDVRGAERLTKGIKGDGIGLFWIKYVLSSKFGIEVNYDVTKEGPADTKFCLNWEVGPEWLTEHGDTL